MAHRLIVSRRAEREAGEAFEWYEEQLLGLGPEFLEALDAQPAEGPRGGRTTVSASGMVRKSLWLHGDEAEALRERAYRERRAESEIMREALRWRLGIED